MTRARWAAPLLTAALFASGCGNALYFLRDTPAPMQALEVRMDPYARRECLVVFMPGLLDTPDSFREHGFLEDAARASDRCDLVAVDAHLGYYRSGQVRERVREDILRLAETRGYTEFWVVGISMGGMGALLVAQDNASRVNGVVLLAPFLGDEALLREIADAGGLARWEGPEDVDPFGADGFDDALWGWLRGYADPSAERPELYLGHGVDDDRPGLSLLVEHVSPRRYGTTPGGHNWTTWRVLWRRLLASPPWDPAPGAPPTMSAPPASPTVAQAPARRSDP